jgi:hypothetical protein
MKKTEEHTDVVVNILRVFYGHGQAFQYERCLRAEMVLGHGCNGRPVLRGSHVRGAGQVGMNDPGWRPFF